MARSDTLTLFDVMQAVREEAANEQETLATVVHLITSGQVRLSADAIKAIRELSAPTHVAA
jgi:DNA-binding transcriptional regulator YiaG